MFRRSRFHKQLWFAALIACVVVLPAQGACALPPAPNRVPDGATAAEQELVIAMQTLKRYSTDVSNYIKCLEFEEKQQRLSTEERTRLHNSAADGLQAIAAKFNEQVRIFKARSG